MMICIEKWPIILQSEVRGKKGSGKGPAKFKQLQGGSSWGGDLQQMAQQQVSVDGDGSTSALTSKLLDHVSAQTGERRGRLQAEHCHLSLAALPKPPRNRYSGSTKGGFVDPLVLVRCTDAALLTYSGVAVGQGAPLHLLLFAPAAVVVIVATVAREFEIQIDVADDLEAFRHKVADALALRPGLASTNAIATTI